MKALLLAGLSGIALGSALGWGRRAGALRAASAPRRQFPGPPHAAKTAATSDVAAAARAIAMYGVVPLWIAAGLADWACHRASDVEHTAGASESLTHLLMLAEMAVPSLAGLFLEINTPVVALMLSAFLLHEVTALADVSYAVGQREVTPIEQHVHSFLELMPLASLFLLASLHWRQFAGLLNSRDADWQVRLKDEPLPAPYLASVLGAIALFNALPYGEELWRALQAKPGENRRSPISDIVHIDDPRQRFDRRPDARIDAETAR